ncbi:hypothetical protein BV900_27930 [Agrobacterium tumefaciens]|nr:hypothetical protein BV900_27930 [Agrobacterium tumefaciens]
MSKHDDWLHAAGRANSFQRMYTLAQEIMNETGDPHLQRSAVRVVDILETVIDKTLANSRQLREARRRFTVLLVSLASLTTATDAVSLDAP